MGNNALQNENTTGKDSVKKMLRRNLSFKRMGLLVNRGINVIKKDGIEALVKKLRYRISLATHTEYAKGWRFTSIVPLKKEIERQAEHSFLKQPRISIIVPLYNTPIKFLHQMIKSVQAQSYSNWELVLVDASDETHSNVGKAAENYTRKDGRIRLYEISENKGIAANTNEGFARAGGDYFALLDHDDTLQPHALYETIKAINEKGADLMFSDEIVLDGSLKTAQSYLLKFAYGPDTLRGCNYMTHFCVFKRSLLHTAGGGERSAFDGAQDYDLILRLSEKTQNICHIPKVLYIWRGHSASTAGDISSKPYAIQAGADAINAHLQRVGLVGKAMPHPDFDGAYKVKYEIKSDALVSVIIPSYNHAEDLLRCVESLYTHAGKTSFELLIVENNSTEPEVEELYLSLAKEHANIKILRYEGGFNFSAICNFGVRQAKGEHILLLNNDIEIISPDFLDEMLSYSQRKDVGAVGALLFYPNDEIQHAGLFIGIGGTVGVNQKGQVRGNGGDMFRLCTVQNMSAVTGAALMVKTQLYKDSGGLDETSFGVAFNDVDFCLRLRGKGLWNVFTPFAVAYHFESKSRGYDLEGEAKIRYDKEAAAFKAKYADILANGDPFYSPFRTLVTENYAMNLG